MVVMMMIRRAERRQSFYDLRSRVGTVLERMVGAASESRVGAMLWNMVGAMLESRASAVM